MRYRGIGLIGARRPDDMMSGPSQSEKVVLIRCEVEHQVDVSGLISEGCAEGGGGIANPPLFGVQRTNRFVIEDALFDGFKASHTILLRFLLALDSGAEDLQINSE